MISILRVCARPDFLVDLPLGAVDRLGGEDCSLVDALVEDWIDDALVEDWVDDALAEDWIDVAEDWTDEDPAED